MEEKSLVKMVRSKAAEGGFFRACLGSETADAMANGTMPDEMVLQTAYSFALAVSPPFA